MKKIYIFLISILIISVAFFYIQFKHIHTSDKNNKFVLYNWGDYIDPNLIKKFEDEYGYNVEYETFDSNESMYIKLKEHKNNYDLIIPSDYMISRLIKENMLEPIDYSKIYNFDTLDKRVLNQNFDMNNKYSIPYFWGTVGIVYNKKLLDENNQDYPVCYSDLLKPEYNNSILLTNSTRESLMIGLSILNKSINTTNPKDIDQAIEVLAKMSNNIKGIVDDEIKSMMIENEAPISIGWSGDAKYMMNLNENLNYIIPCEGGNKWIDSMVIPKNAKNKQAAYDFLNFITTSENARINSEYVGYESPNKEIYKENSSNNKNFYPSTKTMNTLKPFIYTDENQVQMYEDKFLKYKILF